MSLYTIVLGMLVLPGVVFALVYSPIVTHLSRSLVSPYPKADVRKRLLAAAMDASIVVTGALLYWRSNLTIYLALGAAYLLLRDGVRGQSIGKLIVGLTVISLDSGRPSTLATSARRNALLLLPGANIVAVFLEARTIVRDRQGQRLGDRLAQTQVVDGLAAKELVKSFQDSLMDLGAAVGRSTGDRGRAPVGVDRRHRAA